MANGWVAPLSHLGGFAAIPQRLRLHCPDAYTCLVRPWIKYSLIRLVLFGGVFTVLMVWTPAPFWLAAVIAAAVGLCVSYIFFRPQRDEVAASIAARRSSGDKNMDSDEDTALDSREQ
ncbi:MAG: hypothetical protein JWQ43_3308 [Glaciihabitans sp.]|nr:hypothetical protein [Glaciihabitans sp.]